MNKVPINFHVVAGGWLNAKIRAALSVDGDSSGGNQFITMTARTDAGTSQKTIEAHRTKLKG